MFLVSICRRGIVGVTVELRHLRYFVAVAEAENVLRAATQKLHVSQPAVSRQIRDLEDELGVQLFQRTGKAVSLTDAGRVFLREARAVLESAAHLAIFGLKNCCESISGGRSRRTIHLPNGVPSRWLMRRSNRL